MARVFVIAHAVVRVKGTKRTGGEKLKSYFEPRCAHCSPTAVLSLLANHFSPLTFESNRWPATAARNQRDNEKDQENYE
jgi:hypothetical protein